MQGSSDQQCARLYLLRAQQVPELHRAEILFLEESLASLDAQQAGPPLAIDWQKHWVATRIDLWRLLAKDFAALGCDSLEAAYQHAAAAVEQTPLIAVVAAQAATIAAALTRADLIAIYARDLTWASGELAVTQNSERRAAAEATLESAWLGFATLGAVEGGRLILADSDLRGFPVELLPTAIASERIAKLAASLPVAPAPIAASIDVAHTHAWNLAEQYREWRRSLADGSRLAAVLDQVLPHVEIPGFPHIAAMVENDLDLALVKASLAASMFASEAHAWPLAAVETATSTTLVEARWTLGSFIHRRNVQWWNLVADVLLAPLIGASRSLLNAGGDPRAETSVAMQRLRQFVSDEDWREALEQGLLGDFVQACIDDANSLARDGQDPARRAHFGIDSELPSLLIQLIVGNGVAVEAGELFATATMVATTPRIIRPTQAQFTCWHEPVSISALARHRELPLPALSSLKRP